MEWEPSLQRSRCIEGGNGYESLRPLGSRDESLKKILPEVKTSAADAAMSAAAAAAAAAAMSAAAAAAAAMSPVAAAPAAAAICKSPRDDGSRIFGEKRKIMIEKEKRRGGEGALYL